MNLEKIYREEDVFPRAFTCWEERDYGILFYNEANRDSYDSNHAVIFESRIHDLHPVLDDIVSFYQAKGLKPIIYQSISDEGYFERNRAILSAHGFESWSETQQYMVLSAPSAISPNPEIDVRKVSAWQEAYGTEIFQKAGEPWEIPVAKRLLDNPGTLFFVAFCQGKPVGMTYAHVRDDVCRVDYLLVSKEHRRKGVGRALIHSLAAYCRANPIALCFLWPDGDTAERIYAEAGFRHVATRRAGRACLVQPRR